MVDQNHVSPNPAKQVKELRRQQLAPQGIEAFRASDEIILCAALLDALTFWNHGYRNVSCTFGRHALSADLLAAFREFQISRALTCCAETGSTILSAGIDCRLLNFPNGLGTNDFARQVADTAEVETDDYSYYAFGKVATTSGTTENAYRWVGELGYYHDVESGLNLLGRRPLGTDTGRFLSEDPIRYDHNPYRYVANDPTNATDPSGLRPFVRIYINRDGPWGPKKGRGNFKLSPSSQNASHWISKSRRG